MGSQRMLIGPLYRRDPGQIGPYVLLGRLGAGSMGRVYLGRSAAGRLVAVKTIKPEYAEEADFRARFAQEVAAARRVSGVFTAAVVAADPDAEVPWLATAYVPAPSLAHLVETCGPLPVPVVRWLAAGCAEALESIHEAGLVHRDLKPSNVLVAPDGPRVIDFGVARAVERIQLTTTHGAVGTPAYMAPEQARDTMQAVVASDVFSLGSTLLFAASGHAPYHGETIMDILVQLATEEPDLSGLPSALTDLVTECLDRDPGRRPTPAALLTALAPELTADNGHESGLRSLPDAGRALIDEYRQPPQPAPRVDDPMAEATVGSQPAAVPASPRPQSPGAQSPGARSSGAQSSGRGRAGAGRVRPARSGGWHTGRVISAVVAAGAVVSLVVFGVLLRGWVDRGGGNQAAQTSPTGFQPPPGGDPDRRHGYPPGPPPGGAGGTPQLSVNQYDGDMNSVFVVSGTGWQPGSPVTVALGGKKSPHEPVADNGGKFGYAINQCHEFFPGQMPVDNYKVVATAPGGRRAEATFYVHP